MDSTIVDQLKKLVDKWTKESARLEKESDGESVLGSCTLSGEAHGLLRAAKGLKKLIRSLEAD